MRTNLNAATSLICLLAISFPITTMAQETKVDQPEEILMTVSATRAIALEALHRDDWPAVKQAAETMVRQHPNDPRAARVAGDLFLRSGNARAALQQFENFLDAEPSSMPELWQRGIALYFVHEYRKAAKQFEAHRGVNPNDVENAAWHFLCIAKSSSPEAAKKMVLPAPNDPRVPMQEVLEMLSSGDTDAVARRIDEVSALSPKKQDASFFGNLYLGLYADAMGDDAQALKWISKASKDAPHHYMGDISKVYAEHLEK